MTTGFHAWWRSSVTTSCSHINVYIYSIYMALFTVLIHRNKSNQGFTQIKEMASQLRKQMLGSNSNADADASLVGTNYPLVDEALITLEMYNFASWVVCGKIFGEKKRHSRRWLETRLGRIVSIYVLTTSRSHNHIFSYTYDIIYMPFYKLWFKVRV